MVAAKIQLLMAIGVALSVVQAGPVDNSNGGNRPVLNNKAICTTQECVVTAAGILNDMDHSADPCQDFNQFTCGGFDENNEIPSGLGRIGYIELLRKANNRIIRSIVDVSHGKSPKPAPGDVASQANLKKLQDLFASCMDEPSILKSGRKPLVDSLQIITQSLPASDAPASKAILSKALGQMMKSGVQYSPLMQLTVEAAVDDPLANEIIVYEYGLGLDLPADYKNAELVRKYTELASMMFQIALGEEDVVNRAQPLTEKDVEKKWVDVTKEVVGFESELAGIRTPTDELYDPSQYNNPRTVEQLNGLTPSMIDWSILLPEALPAGVNYTRPIIATSLPFLTKLDALLQKTPARTLQHYFSWVAIQKIGTHLATPYSQPLDDLYTARTGTPIDAQAERWKSCASAVEATLGQMAGHYYVEEAFKGKSREEVIKLIDNIILSYEKTFPTLSWLDKITREGALKKLKAIVKTVGYSTVYPDVASSVSLEEFYKGFTVESGDYIGNRLRHASWAYEKSFEKLDMRTDRLTMDYMFPSHVNAYFHSSFNTINFPAGILQGVFFGVNYPEYVNYGGIGVVAGHEIGWWTNETSQAFKDKSQCFVEQYGNFTVLGPDGKQHNLNGQLTLGENLADNGGLKMAFKIWQSRFKSDSYGRK
ncbi:hypothetical protein BGZ96_000448 [Linnemannia gamsii]|uniref:Uncharacterized protein n=1 Tax=Linnemannia gamsii TaxID=64522 RepID=A0ABQ7KAS2_9FUNG|nr:hypothetical protein BGZ96_000448 [Linnemannia gamsii]